MGQAIKSVSRAIIGCISRRLGSSAAREDPVDKMANTNMDQVQNVDIDPSGKFKYILIEVKDPQTKAEKFIVRGYKSCPYHVDIFNKVEPSLKKLGLKAECVGGGRIKHDPNEKSLFVYGYSQGFGRADHTIAQKLLKEKYSDYTDINWSNEGY